MNNQRLEMINILGQTYNIRLKSHKLLDEKTNKFEFIFKMLFPITQKFLSNFEHEFKTHKIPFITYKIQDNFLIIECEDLIR